MGDELARAVVAGGLAVDDPLARLEDAGLAAQVAAGAAQELCLHLQGDGHRFLADDRHRGEPERHVGQGHHARSLEQAPGPVEVLLVRQPDLGRAVADRMHAKPPPGPEPGGIDDALGVLDGDAR